LLAEGVPEILAIAKGTDISLSQQAVSTLGRFGVSAVPELADVLLNHPNPEIRRAAAYTLWWNKDHNAIPHLVKALQTDVSPEVRASAARSLAEIGIDDVSAVMALSKALKDRDSSVQENAAYALRVIIKQSSPAAKVILSGLIVTLKVPNGKVQSEVASVLGNIGKEANAAVPVIIGGLSAPPKFKIGEGSYFRDPQHSFISTLGKIGVGDSNAVSVLIEILKDPSRKSLHDSSATALGELGSIARRAIPSTPLTTSSTSSEAGTSSQAILHL
jgi:HEAT repeat protein